MCFNNKYKYETLSGGCYQITTKKKAGNEKQTFFERFH